MLLLVIVKRPLFIGNKYVEMMFSLLWKISCLYCFTETPHLFKLGQRMQSPNLEGFRN